MSKEQAKVLIFLSIEIPPEEKNVGLNGKKNDGIHTIEIQSIYD